MKKILLAALLLVAGTLQAQDKTSVVIKTSPGKEFLYWYSGEDYLSDYEQGFARGKTGKTDSTGCWSGEFAIDKPVTLNVAKMKKTIMTVLPLYLTPGSCDTVVIQGDEIRFQGTNAEYNRCLQETESFIDCCNQFLIGRPSKDPLFQTKSFPEFAKLLDERKAETERKIMQYKGLAPAFVDEQRAHVDLGSRVAFIYKAMFNIPDSLQTEDWKQASKEMVNKQIDTPYFRSFRDGFFLLSGLLGLEGKLKTGGEAGKKLSLDSFEQLAKRMEGKNLECAWATLINDDIVYKTYDPIVPQLYDRLKERFPANTYRSFLEAGIGENNRFNGINVADNAEEDYQVISCDPSFRSLADVVQSLKGKVVYVDLWATWCSSCLAEFPSLPQVEEKVKGLDVAFLYISLDKQENKERWEKSFRHYKLKGYHLLATPALSQAISKEFGNYIPHAILFDKEGKIVERNAPGFKQSDKLYELLVKYCKLN